MQAHAVVLDLPAKLCANRATNRVDHEGGLDGPKAKQAVYRMGSQLAKAGPPQASEGLSSVMVRLRSCSQIPAIQVSPLIEGRPLLTRRGCNVR